MNKNNETRIIQRLFWSLVPVQALAVGLPAINALINSFIVGNYLGSSALAATGFASPMLLLITAVSSTLGLNILTLHIDG